VREVATVTEQRTSLEDVLAETGWHYHKSVRGRFTLHYAFRYEDGEKVEHRATNTVELLRRVFEYLDKHDPVFQREIRAGRRG
jgi:hypothetical protein